MLNEQQFYLFGEIQTSQTGGQPYTGTSPYGECSLLQPNPFFVEAREPFVISIQMSMRIKVNIFKLTDVGEPT